MRPAIVFSCMRYSKLEISRRTHFWSKKGVAEMSLGAENGANPTAGPAGGAWTPPCAWAPSGGDMGRGDTGTWVSPEAFSSSWGERLPK